MTNEERLQREVDSLKYQLGIRKIKSQHVLLQLEEANNALEDAKTSIQKVQDQLRSMKERLPRVEDFVKMHWDIMEAKEEVGPSKAVKVLVRYVGGRACSLGGGWGVGVDVIA